MDKKYKIGKINEIYQLGYNSELHELKEKGFH